MKAIKKPIPKTEEAKQIIESTEIHFINTMIRVNAMAQANLRKDLKRLMKEKQLLINIKKKWKS
jgi:hypothetical protein